MNHAIKIENLSVKLPGFELKNVNMNIPKGIILGLIGKNGAGKTTLLKTMTDVYAPTQGSIIYGDKEMQGNAREIKMELGIVYDSLFYPPGLKAQKVAKLIAPFYKNFDMKKWEMLMQRFQLDMHKAPAQYSKGMQMKFMLAMALAHNPKILILDEPTAGLDPAARAEMMDIIQEFMENEENTVIFSTHITSDLDKIADYIALISQGELRYMEEKEQLMEMFSLVQIEKHTMSKQIEDKIIGMKENAFGYVGLTRERDFFVQMPEAKLTRATLEDLLIYQNE
ncbi:MAG: ABC transporter ATP-binding protein [Lachnospiraceae bacterium]|nr:ABC transporter ATP-binding protein [Lachnospiraceae bacterium]